MHSRPFSGAIFIALFKAFFHYAEVGFHENFFKNQEVSYEII